MFLNLSYTESVVTLFRFIFYAFFFCHRFHKGFLRLNSTVSPLSPCPAICLFRSIWTLHSYQTVPFIEYLLLSCIYFSSSSSSQTFLIVVICAQFSHVNISHGACQFNYIYMHICAPPPLALSLSLTVYKHFADCLLSAGPASLLLSAVYFLFTYLLF